jgi:hypothetical protein
MCLDPSRNVVVLYGGVTTLPSTYSTDTWEWNGTDWTQITTAHHPNSRFVGALGFDPATNKLILQGGFNGSSWITETWTYNGTDWTQLTPTHAPVTNSSLRRPFSCYDPGNNNLVLWVEIDASTAYGLTYLWNGTDWIAQSPTNKPPHRLSPLTYDPRIPGVVLGPGSHQGTTFVYNDVWVWDGSDWTQDTATMPSPPFSSFNTYTEFLWEYSSFCHGAIMFSGSDGNNDNMQQTWRYDNLAHAWTDLAPSSPPTGRGGGSTFGSEDPATGKILMYGGNSPTGSSLYNDTWLFSCAPTAVPHSYGTLVW